MLIFAIWFLVGLLIGVGSLRLLAFWEPKTASQRLNVPYKRHHS